MTPVLHIRAIYANDTLECTLRVIPFPSARLPRCFAKIQPQAITDWISSSNASLRYRLVWTQ